MSATEGEGPLYAPVLRASRIWAPCEDDQSTGPLPPRGKAACPHPPHKWVEYAARPRASHRLVPMWMKSTFSFVRPALTGETPALPATGLIPPWQSSKDWTTLLIPSACMPQGLVDACMVCVDGDKSAEPGAPHAEVTMRLGIRHASSRGFVINKDALPGAWHAFTGTLAAARDVVETASDNIAKTRQATFADLAFRVSDAREVEALAVAVPTAVVNHLVSATGACHVTVTFACLNALPVDSPLSGLRPHVQLNHVLFGTLPDGVPVPPKTLLSAFRRNNPPTDDVKAMLDAMCAA